jgi:hypothetical protein
MKERVYFYKIQIPTPPTIFAASGFYLIIHPPFGRNLFEAFYTDYSKVFYT